MGFRLLAIPLAIATVYFTLAEGQWFLWVAGPVGLVFIYFATAGRDKHREIEVESWRESAGGPMRVGDVVRRRRGGTSVVAGPPRPMVALLQEAGQGKPVATFELVPGLAYVAVVEAGILSGSEHQTVLLRLEEKTARMSVRPLPIVEGKRQRNPGLVFKKDPRFSELFIVEGMQPRAIRGFLSPAAREALRKLPDVWLRVDGDTLALTLYGRARSDKLEKLVQLADALFAEHGAEGGPSLLAPKKTKKTKKTTKKPADAAAPAPVESKTSAGSKASPGSKASAGAKKKRAAATERSERRTADKGA